jgi:hypothetical protein
LKPNVANIQLRLRVWMIPIESNVADSNMANSLKLRIQPRRLGGQKVCRGTQTGNLLASGAPARKRNASGGDSRTSDHPNRYHCACVDTAHKKTVPDLPGKISAVR